MTDLPPVRIVRGAPDDDEVAALIAGLAAAQHDDAEPPAPRSAWRRGRVRAADGATPAAFGRPADDWRWSLRG